LDCALEEQTPVKITGYAMGRRVDSCVVLDRTKRGISAPTVMMSIHHDHLYTSVEVVRANKKLLALPALAIVERRSTNEKNRRFTMELGEAILEMRVFAIILERTVTIPYIL
jgi:hypothetical protein